MLERLLIRNEQVVCQIWHINKKQNLEMSTVLMFSNVRKPRNISSSYVNDCLWVKQMLVLLRQMDDNGAQ